MYAKETVEVVENPRIFRCARTGLSFRWRIVLAASGFGMSAKRTLFTRFNIPGGRLVEFTLLEFFEDWDGRAANDWA